ncbi:MAG TPA: hypothetical protein VGM39_05490 [Kofleriaceae bacterium]|jgi:hypothetical protein
MNRVVLALLLTTACGKSPAPAAGTPEPTVKQPSDASGFKLGEATVIELLDKNFQPVSRPLWRLHADGKTEGVNRSGEWRDNFVEAKPDGTLWMQGHQLAKVTDKAITYTSDGGPPPIAIDGDTLSVVVWQKAHDGEDYTAKIELASDGAITVHHRDGTRVYWKIEAADPAVMRTAYRVFALSMKTILD